MGYLKRFGLSAMMAIALTAAAGSGLASATTLEVGGSAKNSWVSATATLQAGTSLLIKDEYGTTTDTCSFAEYGFSTTYYSGVSVEGVLSPLNVGSCTHTTKVLRAGTFRIFYTSGTNGWVSVSSTEVTVQSTFFGANAVCSAGSGTNIGTLTGTSSGPATLDVNATMNCGILGSAKWTGTYSVTSPWGLGVTS